MHGPGVVRQAAHCIAKKIDLVTKEQTNTANSNAIRRVRLVLGDRIGGLGDIERPLVGRDLGWQGPGIRAVDWSSGAQAAGWLHRAVYE